MVSAASENVSFLLITAGRLLRARFERALARAQLEITPGEGRALVLLGLLGPVRQNELATALSVEPMTMVGYLDRMEQHGLVKRQPDPSDGRAKLLTMTSTGRSLEKRIVKILSGERDSVFGALDAGEVDVLKGLLQRLCRELSTTEPDAEKK
jgi:MarR family transcriptional regulator, transcriptional regulator for hemolysin